MKAVLFDMDGILIDTEKYLTVYKQKAMREAGYRLDLETAYKFRSCASVFAREQMKGIFGEDFPYDELRRRRQELMVIILRVSELRRNRMWKRRSRS